MGKVGTGSVQASMHCVNKFYSNEHFTGDIVKKLTFKAKGCGSFSIHINGQFYSRKPSRMNTHIRKNGKGIARSFGDTQFMSVSAVTNYEPGDTISAEILLGYAGDADAGCEYWLSASANEEINFVES